MAQKTSLSLDIIEPSGTRRTEPCEAESLIVGSGSGAALKLSDPSLSAMHCLIRREDGRVMVIDLGSESGTWIAGRSIREPTPVEPGETIAVGGSRITLALDEAASSQATSIVEVVVRFGDAVVGFEQLLAGGVLRVGEGRESRYPLSGLEGPQVLARATGSTVEVTVPSGGRVSVRPAGAGRWLDRAALSAEGRLQPGPGPGPGGETVAVQPREEAVAELGGLTFSFRFARQAARIRRVALAERDFTYFKVASLCWLAFFALVAALEMTPPAAWGDSDALDIPPVRYVRLMAKLERPKDKARPNPTQEARRRETEPKVDEAVADRREPTRRSFPTTDEKREADRQRVTRLMSNMFGGGKGSNLFGGGGLGANVTNALGELKGGGSPGDGSGLAGLGVRGSGAGSGGAGLGLGGLGARGVAGGAGTGTGELPARAKDTVRIVPGKTTIIGGLDREVIMKVISRHQNEIKFCYESELQKNPKLAGKVALSWTIDPSGVVVDAAVAESTVGDGAVEKCMLERVRRWRFPAPEGGGVVAVTFPWIFKAAGDESVD